MSTDEMVGNFGKSFKRMLFHDHKDNVSFRRARNAKEHQWSTDIMQDLNKIIDKHGLDYDNFDAQWDGIRKDKNKLNEFLADTKGVYTKMFGQKHMESNAFLKGIFDKAKKAHALNTKKIDGLPDAISRADIQSTRRKMADRLAKIKEQRRQKDLRDQAKGTDKAGEFAVRETATKSKGKGKGKSKADKIKELPSRIGNAWKQMTEGRSDKPVNLADLRKKFRNVDKATLNKVLVDMHKRGDIELRPYERKSFAIKKSDLDSAINIDGVQNNLLYSSGKFNEISSRPYKPINSNLKRR